MTFGTSGIITIKYLVSVYWEWPPSHVCTLKQVNWVMCSPCHSSRKCRSGITGWMTRYGAHVWPTSQQQEVQEWNHRLNDRVNDQIWGSCVAHVTAAGSAGAESPGLFIGFWRASNQTPHSVFCNRFWPPGRGCLLLAPVLSRHLAYLGFLGEIYGHDSVWACLWLASP